jgi:hypothetical protein
LLRDARYFISFTTHVPGEQFIDTAVVVAVPVQLWGPLRVILPPSVTLPLNSSKGAAKDSAQAFCDTCKVIPMNDESQWAVMSHAPLMSGQLPVLPAPPCGPASDESELQAAK